METESFEDFEKRVKRVSDKRENVTRNAHYSQESNKYYTAHRPKEKRFVVYKEPHSLIVRRCNELLIEHFVENGVLKLPCGMGTLMLVDNGKFTPDGKRKRVRNWKKTLKLWYKDRECMENRTCVYNEKNCHYVIYSKKGANYKNSGYYQFYIHRSIKDRIYEKVKQGLLDGYKIY